MKDSLLRIKFVLRYDLFTKRELSEHHYYRTVGSGSFFIAADVIILIKEKPSGTARLVS